MPYINEKRRYAFNCTGGCERENPETPGELNYVLTDFVTTYLSDVDRPLNYAAYNEVIGVLECMKLEIYRRVISRYEDWKKMENGDVYGPPLIWTKEETIP